jgi:hypothetical protein
MRYITAAILLSIAANAMAQQKQCHCDKDSLMNDATISCETSTLKNNSTLYWQYNCDSIWLTLENKNGKKTVLDEVEPSLFPYTYRLGYHLIKEYNSSLLFRSGCPANGPCNYTLIDKSNGKKLEAFKPLICVDTDNQLENPHPYEYNFVVYFSEVNDSLVVYFVDGKKYLQIPFNSKKNKLSSPNPEQQFKHMKKSNDTLTLAYENDEKQIKELKIPLDKGK